MAGDPITVEDGIDKNGPFCRVMFGGAFVALLNKIEGRWHLSWVTYEKPFDDKDDAISHVRFRMTQEPSV